MIHGCHFPDIYDENKQEICALPTGTNTEEAIDKNVEEVNSQMIKEHIENFNSARFQKKLYNQPKGHKNKSFF